MNLTGQGALDLVVEAQKNFFCTMNVPAGHITMTRLVALGLLKLGADYFGHDYARELWRDGVAAFERLGIHGLSVEIVPGTNYDVRCWLQAWCSEQKEEKST